MNKPFYMLQGEINLTKEVKFKDGKIDMIEKHYQDIQGNKAIIIVIDRKNELTQRGG